MPHISDEPQSEDLRLARFVCESANEYAIFTMDLDGAIATWNPGAERAFGYRPDEVLGRNFALIFPFEDVADGVPAGELRAAVVDGRVHRHGWHVRKDGSRFWGSNVVEPLIDRRGRRVGYAKIVREDTGFAPGGRVASWNADGAGNVLQAIERDELFLEYQPILSLRDLGLVGFEALVRWRHPVRGVLAPADFIPLAEVTGSIVAVDRWVLRAACRQLRAWQADLPEAAGLTMSVNVSAKQFVREDLCRTIAQSLESSEIRGASLKLEITESAIMQSSGKVSALLAAIRALEVEVQIDDFGTGYSSLSDLRVLPVSAVKLDRSFVSGMDAHEERARMARAIVTLAHNLRLAVIAEGIETPEELEALRALSCECGQGFLFSAPLEPQAARAIIETSPEAAV